MATFFCGLDLGTSNLKVVLADGRGAVAALRACPTPRRDAGGAEVGDPDEILRAVEDLVAKAWSDLGARSPSSRIAAIAAAGTGEDGFLLDAREIRPLGPALPWYDRRAEAEARELAARCDVVARSGIGFDPARTAAKWLWLARNAAAPPPGAVWIQLTDWPLVAWSGRPAMTEALAARSGTWDVAARRWIPEALAASRAPPLPRVLRSGEVIGRMGDGPVPPRLPGVDRDTLLVCGGHDHPVAASVVLRARPDGIVDSLGTAELIYCEAAGALAPQPALVRTAPILPGMTSACLHVFDIAGFLGEIAPDDLRRALSAVPPPGAWDGEDEGDPVWRRLRLAAFVLAEVLDRMRRAGMPRGPVIATGGRARSDALMQVRADVAGEAMIRAEEEELCALGAALIAARAAGVNPAPVVATRRFDPRPAETGLHMTVRRAMAARVEALLGDGGPGGRISAGEPLTPGRGLRPKP